MKKYLFLLFSTAVCLVSCKKETVTFELIGGGSHPVFSKSFVRNYIRIYEIKGTSPVTLQDDDSPQGYSLRLSFRTNQTINSSMDEAYDAYCEKYGDTSFNQYFLLRDADPICGNIAVDNDFKSLEITCLSEFMGREKGSSVGDIVVFSSKSALPFIKSGYKDPQITTYEHNGVPIVKKGDGFVNITKKVCDLEQEDMTLLSEDVYITFTEYPSDDTSYPFLIKFTNGSGQIVQEKVSITFSK